MSLTPRVRQIGIGCRVGTHVTHGFNSVVTYCDALIVLFPSLIGSVVRTCAVVGYIFPSVCLGVELLVGSTVQTGIGPDDVVIDIVVAKEFAHHCRGCLRIGRHQQQLHLLRGINLGTVIGHLIQFALTRRERCGKA